MQSDTKDTQETVCSLQQQTCKLKDSILQKLTERKEQKKQKKQKNRNKHPIRYAAVSGFLLFVVTTFLEDDYLNDYLTYIETRAEPSAPWESVLSEFDTLYSTFTMFSSDTEKITMGVCLGFFAMVLFGLISKGLEAKEVTLTESPIDWFFVVSGNVFCQMLIERILLANGIIVKGILFLVFPVIILVTALVGLVRKILQKTFMTPITKRIWAPIFAHLIVLTLTFILLTLALAITNLNRYAVPVVLLIQAVFFFRLSNHLVDRLGDGCDANDKREDVLGGRIAIIILVVLFVFALLNVWYHAFLISSFEYG